MARKKTKGSPAPTDEQVAEGVTVAEEPQPKYTYQGPDVPRLFFPSLQVSIRPQAMIDEDIDALLTRHPQLKRYWV